MANRPAKAGAASAGPDWGLTGLAGSTGPARPTGLGGADAPPPVHHQGYPSAPQAPPVPRDPRLAHDPGNKKGTAVRGLAWLLYLIALAGVALGLAVAAHGSRLAVRGTELVGGALLVAAVARLLLPSRYAGPLSSRGRASDVAAFTVFGTAVLVVALMLS